MYVSYVEVDKSYRLNGSNLKKEQLRSIKLIILFINYLICSHIKKLLKLLFQLFFQSWVWLKIIEIKLIMPKNGITIDCYILERIKILMVQLFLDDTTIIK